MIQLESFHDAADGDWWDDALDRALAAIGSWSAIVPAGQYNGGGHLHIGQGVKQFRRSHVLPERTIISGEGASTILLAGSSPGDHMGSFLLPVFQPDANGDSMTSIRDLTIGYRLPDSERVPGAAAIEFVGGAGCDMRDVQLLGWPIGIVCDGLESSTIERCYFGGWGWTAPEDTIGVLLCNGSSRGNGFTVPDSTNQVTVRACRFNWPEHPIVHEGGINNVIERCNFMNGGSSIVYGCNHLTFQGCYWESQRPPCAAIRQMPRGGVTTVAYGLRLFDCGFGLDGPVLSVESAVYCFSFDACWVGRSAASGAVHGAAYIAGPTTVLGSYADNCPMFDGDVGSNEVTLYAGSELSGTRNAIGIGTVRPAAALDIRAVIDSSVPGHATKMLAVRESSGVPHLVIP